MVGMEVGNGMSLVSPSYSVAGKRVLEFPGSTYQEGS